MDYHCPGARPDNFNPVLPLRRPVKDTEPPMPDDSSRSVLDIRTQQERYKTPGVIVKVAVVIVPEEAVEHHAPSALTLFCGRAGVLVSRPQAKQVPALQ
jgi:hypothetical protein